MDKLRELNITLPKRSLNDFSRRNQNVDKPSSKLKIFMGLAIVIAISSLAMLTVYAYKHTRVVEDISLLPLVAHDNAPLRTQPEKPGGLIISNQNKSVYHQLRKPLSYDQQKITEPQQAKVQQIINRYYPEQPTEAISAQPEQLPVDTIQSKEELTSEATMPSAPPAKSTIFDLMNREKAESKPLTGLVKVRIAVLKTHAGADHEWERLSHNFKELKDKKHRITEKVAKNGNKMFYLWVVDLQENTAKILCDNLKEGKQGCFIINE